MERESKRRALSSKRLIDVSTPSSQPQIPFPTTTRAKTTATATQSQFSSTPTMLPLLRPRSSAKRRRTLLEVERPHGRCQSPDVQTASTISRTSASLCLNEILPSSPRQHLPRPSSVLRPCPLLVSIRSLSFAHPCSLTSPSSSLFDADVVWQSDDEILDCQHCRRRFGVFLRKVNESYRFLSLPSAADPCVSTASLAAPLPTVRSHLLRRMLAPSHPPPSLSDLPQTRHTLLDFGGRDRGQAPGLHALHAGS